MAKKKIDKLFKPKIMIFVCNWSGLTETDVLAAGAFQGSPSIKVKRIVCSGTIEPALILETLNQGTDGILICGCHLNRCHYINGNEKVEERVAKIKKLLNLLRINTDRLNLEWISPEEKFKLINLIKDYTEKIVSLGPYNNGKK
jgi:F420-non-reducing hydrogenase iron-sulfur subunit